MGAAVALGLVQQGASVLMVDKVSQVQKASRANFGLVWSQSKGSGNRSYARFSEQAVRAFETFARQVEAKSGIDVELRLGAGIILSLGEQEFAARTAAVAKLHREAAAHGEKHPSRLLDRKEIQELVGQAVIGDDVSGGSFSPIDGDVNPLLFLKAMRKVFINRGGVFRQGCEVNGIAKQSGGFQLDASRGVINAGRIVLAAGLGNIALLAGLGRRIPLAPQKGQLLVTEKTAPFLSFPFSGLRQTAGGSVMIGYTQENTGFDTSTTVQAGTQLAKRALKIFPALEHTRVVRSWAGLRILTGDGLPVYDELENYPGCYVLATHSCVTLAPQHWSLLPPWILGRARPARIDAFKLERFEVNV